MAAEIDTQARAAHAAILAMYGQAPSSTPASQQAAISWLLGFEASSVAWVVLPRLLASDVDTVRYYAGNSLYSQVRSRWHTLNAAQKGEVTDQLWTALATGPPDMRAKGRLCLALAAAALQTLGGLKQLIQRAVQLHSAALSAAADGQAGVRLTLVCDLLKSAAELSDELQLQGRAREDVTAAEEEGRGTVLGLVTHIAAGDGSPLRMQAVAEAVAHGLPTGPSLLAGVTSAFACASAWVPDDQAGAPISPAQLSEYLPLVDAALAGITLSDPTCSLDRSCADLLEALFSGLDPEAGEARAGLCTRVATWAVQAGPGVIAAARARGTAGSAESLVRVLKTLMQQLDGWPVTAGASQPCPPGLSLAAFPFLAASLDTAAVGPDGQPIAAIGGAPIGLGVAIGDLLLQAASIPDPALQDGAAEALFEVTYAGMEARHPYYRAQLAGQQALVHTCMVIGQDGPWAAQGPAGEETRQYLRSSPLRDGLFDLFGVLGTGMLGYLRPLLHPSVEQGLGPTAAMLAAVLPRGALTAPLSSRLEAFLFTLLCCCAGPGTRNELCSALIGPGAGAAAGAVDPSVTGDIVAVLVGVLRQEPAGLPAELVCTTCKLVSALSTWLATLPVAGVVQCSQGPPFGPGPVPASPGGAPAFSPLPVAELLGLCATFLLKAMQCTGMVVQGSRVPGPATVAGAEAVLSGKSARAGGGDEGADDDADSDDDDDDAAGPPRKDGGGVVSACAALSIGRLLLQVEDLCTLQDGAVLGSCLQAVEAASAGGLPLYARCTLLELLLSSTRAMDSFSPDRWMAFAQAALGPSLARITAAAARIAGTAAGARPDPADVRTCVVDVACVSKILSLAPATLGDADGGWLGGGGGAIAASSASSSPPSPHMYQFVADAVWPSLDGVLVQVHDSTPAVAVLLHFYRQCVRLFPGSAQARLPGIITAAVGLFAAHLHASALSTLDNALGTLLADSNGVMPPGLVGPVAGLIEEVTRIMSCAPQAALDKDPDVLALYFRLMSTCVQMAQTAMVALPVPTLAASFRLVRAAYSCSRDCAKEATLYLKHMFSWSGAFRAYLLPASLQANARAACSTAAGELGACVACSLTLEGGDNLCALAIEAFTLLSAVAGGAGEAFAGAVMRTVSEVYGERSGRLVQQVPEGSEEHTRLTAALAAHEPLEPAGFLCLRPEEHAGILTRAYQMATAPQRAGGGSGLGLGASSSPTQSTSYQHGGGPEGLYAPPVPPAIRLLLTDYSKLCRRETSRDALLQFGLAAQ